MSHPALTEEKAPIHALPDVERRCAWLLLTWRLHQVDPALSDPARLAVHERLAVPECQLALWESGAGAAPYSSLRALETVWGLRRHRIVAAMDYLRMSHPEGAPRSRPRLDADAADFAVRRDALLARTRNGRASSDESLELSWHLVMGGAGGMNGTTDALVAASFALPAELTSWSATGIGRSTLPVMLAALAKGAHLRVGMEDVLTMSAAYPSRATARSSSALSRSAG